MTKEVNTTVKIMGKTYQIKCMEDELHSLQCSVQYLDEKMRVLRDTGNMLSIDRIAVITALNIAHQFLSLETTGQQQNQAIQQRIMDLYSKLDNALTKHTQLELLSVK